MAVALPVSGALLEVVLLEVVLLEVVLVLAGDMAAGSGEVLVVLELVGECAVSARLPAFKGSGSQSAPVDDPWGLARVMSLAAVDGRREGCGDGENLAGGLDSLPLLVAVGACGVGLLERVL